MRYVRIFLATLLSLLIADGLWLGSMLDRLYRPIMGPLMATQINWIGAIGFYVIYTTGLFVLIILPQSDTPKAPGLAYGARAALLGLVAFGTYDLTALAVIKDWSLPHSLIDMIWGIITTTLAAYVGLWAGKPKADPTRPPKS